MKMLIVKKISVVAMFTIPLLNMGCGSDTDEPEYDNWVGQRCYQDQAAKPYLATSTGSMPVATQVADNSMTPCLSQSDVGSTEPTLAIDKEGTIFYSPAFTNDGVGMIKSKDNGETWDLIIPRFLDDQDHSRVQSFMYMDPTTERLFYHSSKAQIFPPVLKDGFNMTWSDDKGDTWNYSEISLNGFDWGKMYAGPAVSSTPMDYPNAIYFSAPTPISTPAFITWPKEQAILKSLDGGQTWNPVTGVSLSVGENGCPINEWIIMGNGVVAPDGSVYIGYRRCNQFSVAKSIDEGSSWSVIDVPGAQLIDYDFITDVGIFNANYVIGEPITVDTEGNLYVLYPDVNDLPSMSVSRDGGESWSEPVVVSAPEVKRIQYAGITVKEPGTVAVAFYGTEVDGILENIKPYNGYIAETTNAFAAEPTFWSSMVNDVEDPLYPIGFHPGYLAMFIGGDLNEIVQVKYAPNGDIFATFAKVMCPVLDFCNWDDDAHANSVLQGTLGRMIHN